MASFVGIAFPWVKVAVLLYWPLVFT